MSVPPSASCPHHIPSHGFSCWVQGPDKGHFSTSCFWCHKKMSAASLAVWWSVSPSLIFVGRGAELPSAASIPHSWRGGAKMWRGCALPAGHC